MYVILFVDILCMLLFVVSVSDFYFVGIVRSIYFGENFIEYYIIVFLCVFICVVVGEGFKDSV